jgi:nitrite reductase/ring-hydroxylating ferredoxin subunit
MMPEIETLRRLHGEDGLALLRRSWLPLARSAELSEPGSFLTLSVLGQPLLLVRDRSGTAKALANVCSHRHATVADGAGRTRRFVCPYHAWTYDLDGTFVSAPCAKDDLPDAAVLALQNYAAIEWQGWILVCLEGSPPIPAETAPALDAQLAALGVDTWVTARTLDYPSAWNWSLMVENFTESYHHLAVHRTTLQPSWPAAESYGVETNGNHAELRHSSDAEGNTFTVFALFPAMLLAIQSPQPIMFWPRILPRGSDYFDLRIHILAPPILAADDAIMDMAALSIDQIHREDITVMERVWHGSRSATARSPVLVTLEQPLQLFHSFVRKNLNG